MCLRGGCIYWLIFIEWSRWVRDWNSAKSCLFYRVSFFKKPKKVQIRELLKSQSSHGLFSFLSPFHKWPAWSFMKMHWTNLYLKTLCHLSALALLPFSGWYLLCNVLLLSTSPGSAAPQPPSLPLLSLCGVPLKCCQQDERCHQATQGHVLAASLGDLSE